LPQNLLSRTAIVAKKIAELFVVHKKPIILLYLDIPVHSSRQALLARV
jgi:hypothetical protein